MPFIQARIPHIIRPNWRPSRKERHLHAHQIPKLQALLTSQATSLSSWARWSCCSLRAHSSTRKLDTHPCGPSHPLRTGKLKIKLILWLLPNLPPHPHFLSFSHVKTLLGSWIKISGTVQHPSHPIPSCRCPPTAPLPKSPSLSLQAGTL